MDNKLHHIVERIEQSSLSSDEKHSLYATISEGLRSTVLPVLIKYIPKDQLDTFIDNPDTITMDSYTKLIEHAVKDGQALKEIESLMNTILLEAENILAEEGI
jgi:hypothetical protein